MVQWLRTLATHAEDPVWFLTPISSGTQPPVNLLAGDLLASALWVHSQSGVHTTMQAHTYMFKNVQSHSLPCGPTWLPCETLGDWGFGFLTGIRHLLCADYC